MSRRSIDEIEMKIFKAIDGEKSSDALCALGFLINKIIKRSSPREVWMHNFKELMKVIEESMSEPEENTVTH